MMLVHARTAQISWRQPCLIGCFLIQGRCDPPASTRSACVSFVTSHHFRLPASVKQGLTLLGGTTLAQAIPALASPVIARLFTPADIGAFAFVVAVFGVLTPIACLRYDVADRAPGR